MFLVDGRKAYRIIGILLLIFSGFFLVTGFSAIRIGIFAKKRYEQSSGKILRSLSVEDENYYRQINRGIFIGWILFFTGFPILISGIWIVKNPYGLFEIFKLAEYEKDHV